MHKRTKVWIAVVIGTAVALVIGVPWQIIAGVVVGAGIFEALHRYA